MNQICSAAATGWEIDHRALRLPVLVITGLQDRVILDRVVVDRQFAH